MDSPRRECSISTSFQVGSRAELEHNNGSKKKVKWAGGTKPPASSSDTERPGSSSDESSSSSVAKPRLSSRTVQCSLMSAGDCGARCCEGSGYCEHRVNKLKSVKDKRKRKALSSASDSGYSSSSKGKPTHKHLCRAHSSKRTVRSSNSPRAKAKKVSRHGLGFRVEIAEKDEAASSDDADVDTDDEAGKDPTKTDLFAEGCSASTEMKVLPSNEWKERLLARLKGNHFVSFVPEQAAPVAETSPPMDDSSESIPVREQPLPPSEGEFYEFVKSNGVDVSSWTFVEESKWRKAFDKESEHKAQLDREQRQQQFQLRLEENRREHQAQVEKLRLEQRQQEIAHREALEREREERNREYQQLLFEQRIKQQQIEAQEATVRSGVEVNLYKAKFLAGVQQFSTGTVVEIHTVVNEDEVLRASKEKLFKDFETRSQSENTSLSHGWRTGISGGLFVVANAGYNGSTSNGTGTSISSSFGERDSSSVISSILNAGYQTASVRYTIMTTKSGLKVGVTSVASTTLDWDSACTLANSDTQVFLLGGELWYTEYTEVLRIRSFMEKVNSFGRPMPYNFRKEITVSSENLLALAGQVEVLNREALLEKSRLFIETNSRQVNLVQDLNAQLAKLRASHDQAIERAKALNDESHRLRIEWNEKARHYELTIKEKDDIRERLEADRRALDAQKATLSKSHQELLKEYKKFVSRVTALIEAQLKRNDCANHVPVWMSQPWENKMEDIKRTILEPQDWTELLTSWVFKPVQDRHGWLENLWHKFEDEKRNLVEEVAQLAAARDELNSKVAYLSSEVELWKNNERIMSSRVADFQHKAEVASRSENFALHQRQRLLDAINDQRYAVRSSIAGKCGDNGIKL